MAPTTSGDGNGVVDGYLGEIDRTLVAPPAVRAAVMAEMGDGLLEAVADFQERGLPEEEAVRAAIAEFGEPGRIAAAFQPELCARQVRRSALTLMTSGPIVGIAWLAGAVFAYMPPARHHLSGPWWALPLAGVAIVVGIPGLVVAITATGRTGLRLTFPPRLPAKAVSIASVAAVTADATMLTTVGLYLSMTSVSSPLLFVPAIAASLVRICLATRAFRGCRRVAIA